jgi:hypothetical protein
MCNWKYGSGEEGVGGINRILVRPLFPSGTLLLFNVYKHTVQAYMHHQAATVTPTQRIPTRCAPRAGSAPSAR